MCGISTMGIAVVFVSVVGVDALATAATPVVALAYEYLSVAKSRRPCSCMRAARSTIAFLFLEALKHSSSAAW